MKILLETTIHNGFYLGREKDSSYKELSISELESDYGIKLKLEEDILTIENNININNMNFIYYASINKQDAVLTEINGKIELYNDKKGVFIKEIELKKDNLIILNFFRNFNNRRIIIKKNY